MSKEPKDLPSAKQIKRQISSLKLLIKSNKVLSSLDVGSNSIEDIAVEIDKLEMQLDILMNYPTKYNRYFSHDGWIAYGSLNIDLMKNAVDLYEANKIDDAKDLIIKEYSPVKVEEYYKYFIKGIPVLKNRTKYIEYALEDYKSSRYYSCIPLLIMTIDGIVSDEIYKGFHAKDVDLNVWDSLVSTDTGIEVIKNIFQTSRKKSTTEKLTLPYRHGILHGRDLNYDNYEVAAKCWAFLFVIRDWILSKKTENDRLEQFNRENRSVSLKDLTNSLVELDTLNNAINSWQPRIIESKYLLEMNDSGLVEENSPEEVALNFLKYWQNKNYGKMAELCSSLRTDNPRKYVRHVKSEYSVQDLINYEVQNIIDDAPIITIVRILAEIETDTKKSISLDIRCVYESGQNNPIPRNAGGGEWRIVFVKRNLNANN